MSPLKLVRPTFAAIVLITNGAAMADDARVTNRPFVADRIERFSGRTGFQSTIAFAPGERIENVAMGDSSGWQVTPNRAASLLFVKPANASAPLTNMTVVTDRHTYLFELRLDPKAQPVYLMRFTYPVDSDAPPAQAPAVIAAAETVVAPSQLPLDRMNFAWTMRGEKRLYPERVFDDGTSIYLTWSPDRPLPAVLALAPDGKSEGPVNYTARGEFLVVDGIHPRLVLRSGREVAFLDSTPKATAVRRETTSTTASR